MISKIEGNIAKIDLRFVIVDVNGVGFKVNTTTDAIEKATKTKNEKISFWTYLAVRENALDLYGFLDEESLHFFELLIGISGIGPKSALSILNATTIDTIREAVSSGDPTYLTKVSGVGKKSAEKIIIELKDKLGAEIGERPTHNMKDSALAIEALKSLGYGEREAREVVKKLDKNAGTQEIVKQALKILGQ
ncbi:Holliday junction branch migration protein RuvA [Candidatus Nomurabacteria bacterium]|nr:Holliday junction branch migration protein RuvA [Candidatus Nomurabacteria bacterium]